MAPKTFAQLLTVLYAPLHMLGAPAWLWLEGPTPREEPNVETLRGHAQNVVGSSREKLKSAN